MGVSVGAERNATGQSWDVVAFAFSAPDIGALTRERDDLRRDYLRAKYPKDESVPSSGDQSTIPRKPSITNNTLPQLTAEDFIRVDVILLWNS